MSPQQTVDLISVIQGSLSEQVFASTHGLTTREVELAKSHYLAGLADAARARKPLSRAWRTGLFASSLVFVGLISRLAWAGTCAAPAMFPTALGLNHFCADEGALASEINTNTQRLVALITQKVGTLPSGDVATAALTASSATVSGTVNTNTIAPRTGGTVTNSGALTVTGQLDIGGYVKGCGVSPCYCNNVGERALSWGATCANTGHAIYSATFSADAQQRSGFAITCYHVGSGGITAPVAIQLFCARMTAN